MVKSWKTTLLGICALLAAAGLAGKALLDGDPTTMPDVSAVWLAITGLVGLAARDGDKSSEDVGAGE